MERQYDMVEAQYKFADDLIVIFKKKLIDELNSKMPMYASEWRKEMNEIINNIDME